MVHGPIFKSHLASFSLDIRRLLRAAEDGCAQWLLGNLSSSDLPFPLIVCEGVLIFLFYFSVSHPPARQQAPESLEKRRPWPSPHQGDTVPGISQGPVLIAFDLSCPSGSLSLASHPAVGTWLAGIPKIFLDLKMRHVI